MTCTLHKVYMHSYNHDLYDLKSNKKLSYKLADKNTRMFIFSGSKRFQCLLQMYPNLEKIRSDGTLVTQMHNNHSLPYLFFL